MSDTAKNLAPNRFLRAGNLRNLPYTGPFCYDGENLAKAMKLLLTLQV